MPDGSPIPQGYSPRVIEWKQGFERATINMVTGEVDFDYITETGTPEATIRVVSLTEDAPRERIIGMGAVSATIRGDRIFFGKKRRKRERSLSRKRFG